MGVLKSFAKFRRKHLRWSHFIKKRLQHRRIPVNLVFKNTFCTEHLRTIASEKYQQTLVTLGTKVMFAVFSNISQYIFDNITFRVRCKQGLHKRFYDTAKSNFFLTSQMSLR